MKRRDVVPATTSVEVPPELALGRCIEVWADERDAQLGARPSFPAQAHSRWARAFDAYCAERQIARGADRWALVPPRAPWSLDFLVAQGREVEAVRRFEAAGVTIADLPRLREAARERTESLSKPPRQSRDRSGALND